tara:strand:- start:875 stop:1090 length:216 start_codon:yes stop_codon:yes gene_type:complete
MDNTLNDMMPSVEETITPDIQAEIDHKEEVAKIDSEMAQLKYDYFCKQPSLATETYFLRKEKLEAKLEQIK